LKERRARDLREREGKGREGKERKGKKPPAIAVAEERDKETIGRDSVAAIYLAEADLHCAMVIRTFVSDAPAKIHHLKRLIMRWFEEKDEEKET